MSLADSLAAFMQPQGWWSGKSAPAFYSYNPDTGEHRGSGLCDPSPLEENVWLPPAHSTHKAPPVAEPGYAAVWDAEAGAWSLVRDRRGELVFAGNELRRIVTLGEHPELKLEVSDAQYLPGGFMRVWVNDGIAVDFPDEPDNTYRQIVAAWEAKGETVRPAEEGGPAPADAV